VWSAKGSAVTATEGTGPYQYAITHGLLPAGLTLDGSTGAISGAPASNAAGVYTVTVSATDSAAIPLFGSVTFTITIE
jgi:hypothetical protein